MNVKNITVSIDEETHRLARVRAAELGTSVAALVRLADQTAASRRLGFMAGQVKVPDDFDGMGGPEIEKMFEGHLLSAAGDGVGAGRLRKRYG